MIAQGRKYYSEHNSNNVIIEFINTDMCSFEINHKYDLIVFALSVLKHLKTDEQRLESLKKAKEHLNPEEIIVFDNTAFLYIVISV